MALYDSFPLGWYHHDMLLWGEGVGLEPSTVLARGARIEVPDLRTSDDRLKIAYREQNLMMLSALAEGSALQIHWTVEDDYHTELERFSAVTRESPKMTRWCRDRREERVQRYRSALGQPGGGLRRERVHIYIGERMGERAAAISMRQLTSSGHGSAAEKIKAVRSLLSQASDALEQQVRNFANACSLGKVEAMTGLEVMQHQAKVLTPSAALAITRGEAFTELDPERSVRAHCVRSPFQPFARGYGKQRAYGLEHDGLYHAILVMTRPPSSTTPGVMLPLLSANEKNAAITQVIYPLPVSPEVERLRLEMRELIGQMNQGRTDLKDKVLEYEARISRLHNSTVQPFRVLTCIRLWAETVDMLGVALSQTKAALGRMRGVEFMEVTKPATVWHLYRQCIPGFFEEDGYRKWDYAMSNLNLADLMPISSTFVGNLEDAQVLFDSPASGGAYSSEARAGGVVGVRFFAGPDRTPQTTLVTGITGAGKSSVIIDALSQCEHEIDYTYLQEEGMALATYAAVRGIPSVVLKESSELTLNPFDTFGLPLSGGTQAMVSKVAMKFVGLGSDMDRNKYRENLIGEYVDLLYREFADEWKQHHLAEYEELVRTTLAVEATRAEFGRPSDDFLDAYVDYRERAKADPAWAEKLRESFSRDQVLSFQTAPASRARVDNMVFTQLKPEEYPQWSALCSMVSSGRKSTHRTGEAADELTRIASAIAQGRLGGKVGALVDGTTNVDLFGKGLHFDTSYLGDGLLKEIAGFLFPETVRKHIISLPRSQFKIMVIDELKRVIRIPGAIDYIQEMLAQLRKYRACFIGAFQTPAQIDEVSPALSAILMGQAKQHFILRHNDRSEVAKIAAAIGLPPAAERAILSHPLLEHQKGKKATYFTLYANEGFGRSTCGTVRVALDPASLFVVASNGETFDRKMKLLRGTADVVDSIYRECGFNPA